MNEANASRTSLLALLSLFAGLCAVAMVLGALCGVWITERSEMFFRPTLEDYKVGFWAARIVAICAALPALLALILWGAAGAAVRESAGMLRGMALYRTGFILAVVSACLAYFIQGAAAEEWNRVRLKARPDSALSWEDREDLRKRSRTLIELLRADDVSGFASHYPSDLTGRAERWARGRTIQIYPENRPWGSVFSIQEARTWSKSHLTVESIPLESFRRDDAIVFDTQTYGGGTRAKNALYFVFRRIGNDWKVVGPIAE